MQSAGQDFGLCAWQDVRRVVHWQQFGKFLRRKPIQAFFDKFCLALVQKMMTKKFSMLSRSAGLVRIIMLRKYNCREKAETEVRHKTASVRDKILFSQTDFERAVKQHSLSLHRGQQWTKQGVFVLSNSYGAFVLGQRHCSCALWLLEICVLIECRGTSIHLLCLSTSSSW